MKLAFHYHIPAEIRDGQIWTMGLQGLFLDSLAPHFGQIALFLHSPRPGEQLLMDYAIQASNITLEHIGPHDSVPARLWRGNRIAKQVAEHCRAKKIDLLLLRAPTPLLPFLVKKISPDTSFVYLVVGEDSALLPHSQQPYWRKKLIRQYVIWNEKNQKRSAPKAAAVFTNSLVLLEKYRVLQPKTHLLRTTTLRRSDFFQRENTCQQNPLRILCTGRIEAGKGLLTMTEAVLQLLAQGVDCELHLVGWAEPGDTTLAQMTTRFDLAGFAGKLVFHGKKKPGPALFAHYRAADIFVMPSQLSEGFPRTIWEAMAHSLPVLTTPVGSIPHTLRDGHDALFIRPADAVDTAEKIALLATSPDLRRDLIAQAWVTVQSATLEAQAEAFKAQLLC